jgi:cyanophycinase
MEVVTDKQRLLIIGGAEDREDDCLILGRFVKLAGGKGVCILVLTTATSAPERAEVVYGPVFARLGVADASFWDVSLRMDAMADEAVEMVRKATAIFFTGGKQFNTTTLMGGTTLMGAIFKAAKKGVVIAGTSAGAAMMGDVMIIRGKPKLSPRLGSVEIAGGAGFISRCIIDTHFSQRGRHGRLLTAAAHSPQHMGFGVDENTAMLVDRNGMEVIGEGAVTIYDAKGMTYSDVPYVARGQSVALDNIKLHVAPGGFRYDFLKHELVAAKEGRRGGTRPSEVKVDCANSA